MRGGCDLILSRILSISQPPLQVIIAQSLKEIFILALQCFNRLNNFLSHCTFAFRFSRTFQYLVNEILISPSIRPLHREDATLTNFQEDLIKNIKEVLQQQPGESNSVYDKLRKETEDLRKQDLPSPWPRQLMGEVINNIFCRGVQLKWVILASGGRDY